MTLLTKHAFGVDFEGHQIPVSIRERWESRYASYRTVASESRYTTREGFSAIEIQRAWRRRAKWYALAGRLRGFGKQVRVRLHRGKGVSAVTFTVGGVPRRAVPGAEE